MALRIGDLTEATSFVGTDVLELSLAGSAGSRRVTGANLRTQLFAGGTGFTAADPLNAGNAAFTGTLSSTGTTSLATTSGSVIVGAAGLAAQAQVLIRAAAGQARSFVIASGSSTRWNIEGTNTAETGSDAGTALAIRAYTDAAVLIDSPITITRAAGGALTISRPTTINSTATVQTAAGASGFTVGANDSTSCAVNINGAAGTSRQIMWRSAGVVRWNAVTNLTAESGSDAGSNWQLQAYTDAGVAIDSPISITRAAGGTMTLARPVSMSSTLNVTGAITGSSNIYAAAGSNLGWQTRSLMQSPADGIIVLLNNAGTGFTRLTFGPGTSSFAAIRAGTPTTQLDVVLGDNSAFAGLTASFYQAGTGTWATTGNIRLPNNTSISWRNAASSANHTLSLSAADVFALSSNLSVTGQVSGTLINASTALVGPGTVAAAGSVRLANNTNVSWRNAANTADITLTVNGSNLFVAGAEFSTLGVRTQLSVVNNTANTAPFSVLDATHTIATTTAQFTATWNGAAQTFNLITLNVTDTASNAASKLIQANTGGIQRFAVRKDGLIITEATTLISCTAGGGGFANGAAAAAGTLGNAPTAGNPTKWIPIDDAGTTRYIPAW